MPYTHSLQSRSFNSYMVRFKENAKFAYNCATDVSIPIWFDLKDGDMLSAVAGMVFQFLYGSI